MVNAPSFLSGLQGIMNDNLTEYPNTINVLKRFNLYPEVALAGGFRLFDSITQKFGLVTKACYTVNRGRGLSAVQNCEGKDYSVVYGGGGILCGLHEHPCSERYWIIYGLVLYKILYFYSNQFKLCYPN